MEAISRLFSPWIICSHLLPSCHPRLLNLPQLSIVKSLRFESFWWAQHVHEVGSMFTVLCIQGSVASAKRQNTAGESTRADQTSCPCQPVLPSSLCPSDGQLAQLGISLRNTFGSRHWVTAFVGSFLAIAPIVLW